MDVLPDEKYQCLDSRAKKFVLPSQSENLISLTKCIPVLSITYDAYNEELKKLYENLMCIIFPQNSTENLINVDGYAVCIIRRYKAQVIKSPFIILLL